MRAFQIFAGMSEEQAGGLFEAIAEQSKPMYTQMVHAASAALKSRPAYLLKQPMAKRSASMRRALARVSSNALAEELLAIYFLECRKELLIEWLDGVGVEHEDGSLKEDAPAQPPDEKLNEAVAGFRGSGDEPDRDLLLRAFSAQDAIDWPGLDAMLGTPE